MKVAVVIPLHNQAPYIGAAMESLRLQSRPADRIIIIDDGSTDGSIGALVTYSEGIPAAAGSPDGDTARSRIETRTDVLPQSHSGPQKTINRAVAMADDCDFIAILHPSDCFHPRRIERCLAYLEAHPELDLVCTRLRLIDEAGKTLAAETPRARWFASAWSLRSVYDDRSAIDLAEWLGLANFAGTTSNFFARAAYLREHPMTAYPYNHGYYALIMAALDNRLGVLDAELLDHRIAAGDGDSVPGEEQIRETLRMNVDLARLVAPRLATENDLRRAFARYQRAAWSNVSAFRADVFNLLLIEALALIPPKAADALLAELDAARFPELTQTPSRATINTEDTAVPTVGPTDGLADKFYSLRAQLSAVRAGARPWAEFRQLQAELLESRWFALGRLLGMAGPLGRTDGKGAEQKVDRLRERIQESFWLRFGNALGVPSARRIHNLTGQKLG